MQNEKDLKDRTKKITCQQLTGEVAGEVTGEVEELLSVLQVPLPRT